MKNTVTLSLFLALFLSCLFSVGYAQRVSFKGEAISISALSVNTGMYLSAGDMKTRFGNSSSVGVNFNRKLANNWVYGFDLNYHFGNNINESNILDSIRNSKGHILTDGGYAGDVRLFQRGLSTFLKVGKLFPIIGPNQNSGILITTGIGFLQHKIQIEVIENNIPELTDDYKKGYDRLSNGLAFNEFIGYWHMSNQKTLNFYIGAEFTQAFTQSRRSYDYFTQSQDLQKRNDYLVGLKLGLIVPLYKRMPKEFYYK